MHCIICVTEHLSFNPIFHKVPPFGDYILKVDTIVSIIRHTRFTACLIRPRARLVWPKGSKGVVIIRALVIQPGISKVVADGMLWFMLFQTLLLSMICHIFTFYNALSVYEAYNMNVTLWAIHLIGRNAKENAFMVYFARRNSWCHQLTSSSMISLSYQMSVSVTEIPRGITFTARIYRFSEWSALNKKLIKRIFITFYVAVQW